MNKESEKSPESIFTFKDFEDFIQLVHPPTCIRNSSYGVSYVVCQEESLQIQL